MYNYIRQIEVNIANDQSLLESSSEIDKLPFKTYTKHSPDTKITLMGTSFCSRILSDGDFQLTEPWSAKILVEAKNAIHCFPEALRKNFLNNLYRKSLNILKDHCTSAIVLT